MRAKNLGTRLGPVSLLISFIMVGSCSGASGADLDRPTAKNKRPCGEERFRIRISDQEGPALDDVEISTITRDGVRLLLKTNFNQGDTCLDNSLLQNPEVLCILFCREGYHCGALMPDKNLLRFWEMKIALARIMI